jgi:hypothetical protein
MASFQQECPVCATAPTEVDGWGDRVLVKCQRCGKFALAPALLSDLPRLLENNRTRAALMSHIIRRSQPDGSRVLMINHETVESYWGRGVLPKPKEQADDLILWIGDNQPSNSLPAIAAELSLDAWIGSALAKVPGNAQGLRWLVMSMETNPEVPKLFTYRFEQSKVVFSLTLEGWDRYASLKQVQNESRIAFMAMKFGDEELAGVVASCFRPAVQRAGFELRDLQDHKRAGLIDDQIRAGLLAARFILADLTHDSFGAYWQAGFADGRGLPVIYTCKKSKWESAKSHFDTNHMVTVLWDTNDLKSAENELIAIIRTTLRADAKQMDD